MVRIITGKARAVRLDTLEGDNITRPSSARIKEGMFSSIQFEIEGRKVLDLFAGCGQLGLEALSRGAKYATFIDVNREALAVVKKNAEKTRLQDLCHFLCTDYRTYLGKCKETFDLVFLDPPYEMHPFKDILERLVEKKLLNNQAIILCEGNLEDPFGEELPKGITLEKVYRYSISFVHLLRYREEQL